LDESIGQERHQLLLPLFYVLLPVGSNEQQKAANTTDVKIKRERERENRGSTDVRGVYGRHGGPSWSHALIKKEILCHVAHLSKF
jgi:hypothetical protein